MLIDFRNIMILSYNILSNRSHTNNIEYNIISRTIEQLPIAAFFPCNPLSNLFANKTYNIE